MRAALDPVPLLAEELDLARSAVQAAVRLFAEGATVPFVARYRKEATGGLDEVALRAIAERHEYLTVLESRRAAVLAEIEKQGKLDAELRARIAAVRTKAELEDLYLPFRPKRRTRGVTAAERGLGPLAELMWAQSGAEAAHRAAQRFVNPGRDVPDAAAALAGARDICAERLAEDAELRRRVREIFWREGVIRVKKKRGQAKQVTKFDTYASFEERLAKLPSHRYLAIRRGQHEGVLSPTLAVDLAPHLALVRARVPLRRGTPWEHELGQVIDDALERLVTPAVASELSAELELRADRDAIEVFASNLRELLLAAPLGPKAVLGVDPGQRTGCKCAAVDHTGKLLGIDTLYLVQGPAAVEKSRTTLLELCRRHRVVAVAVGNGTYGRETEAFVRQWLREAELGGVIAVTVNEAGASVYSASDLARDEFPDLDLTFRGAVSIARRLQDPLAELVKIEPKSIGVGQYQHDVPEAALERKLDEVVESCVNLVGVDVNTASAPLLARVSGIGPALARRLVRSRDEQGSFGSRQDLLRVSGLGPRTFEQAAGFLRVTAGRNPLDATAVHPERYPLVERMGRDLGVPVATLIGNTALVARLDPARYRDGDVGDFTLRDIVAELDKPGRDPRRTFEPPRFRDDVRELADLRPGMELEGVVTNITTFGAFVDVGVHQDGLVHVSQLADRFVRDPREVVKVGDRLPVRVLEVDLARRRISLTAKRGAPRG